MKTNYTKFKKLIKNDVLENIKLIVYDFDGVMTNNKVVIDEFGNESVTVNRADGLAVSEITKLDILQIIISTEKNLVVQKRAEKLKIPSFQGVDNKKNALLTFIQKNNIDLHSVVYIGNDINDFEVMQIVGIPISPADAHESIKRISKLVTNSKGGEGVIREFYNLIIGCETVIKTTVT